MLPDFIPFVFLQCMEDTDNKTITRLHCQNNVWYFFFNMDHLLTSVTRFKVIFCDFIVLILHLKSHGNIVNVKWKNLRHGSVFLHLNSKKKKKISTRMSSMSIKSSLEYSMLMFCFKLQLHVIFPFSSVYRHTFKTALLSNQGHMMPQGEVHFCCLVVSSEGSLLKSSIHDMTVRPLAVVEIKHPHLIST